MGVPQSASCADATCSYGNNAVDEEIKDRIENKKQWVNADERSEDGRG